jgi:FlaA1/EpsC-like NDP-sugar epimerase
MTKSKKVVLVIVDFLLVLFSFYLAVFIRFEGEPSPQYVINFEWLFLVNAFICIGAYYAFGLYEKLWRYAGIEEMKNIFLANLIAYFPALVAAVVTRGVYYSRSIIFIAALLSFFFTGGIRFLLRVVNEQIGKATIGKKTLIIGANDAGEAILRDILRRRNSGYRPVGFIDENPGNLRIKIHNVPVMGTIDDLPNLVDVHSIEGIVIALPSPPLIRKVMDKCRSLKVEFKVIPALSEILDGRLSVSQIRNVEIEDLLERETVNLDMEPVKAFLTGKRVVVTGAGGSIGSELCRQIIRHNVENLILVGRGENSVYEINLELQGKTSIPLIQYIGDIRDKQRMENLFRTYKPQIVFHAAAHKHVPLMELNPIESVTNNVFGTKLLMELSEENSVENFIMISTDKAVNPCSVMGTTKRMSEMFMKSFCMKNHNCMFGAVRFGNVLDSRGSVVPTFRRQIAMGGPVTVTHEDMTRFFMTIPEAVQLVLQAAAMGKDGEIFILDIGRPMKILELAKNMIKLSGFEPDKDIPIEIRGMRPGEKMEEKLVNAEEETENTSVEKILRVNTPTIPMDEMLRYLDDLRNIIKSEDDQAVKSFLKGIVSSCKFVS